MILSRPEPTPFDWHFSLFGTRVVVNPLFWIITLLMAEWMLRHPDWMMLLSVWVAAVFISILLHEFGHVWMWRVFGVDAFIILHGMGGLAIPTDDSPRRWQRILVSFAGPAIQLVFYVVVLMAWWQLRQYREYPALQWFLSSLLWINLVWALVNLLPIYPLDGGQIARELCQMAATRSQMVNSRPALIASLWISIVTSAAVAFYIVMPKAFGIPQPIDLGVGPITAVMCVLLAVGNFQELQKIRGRRGPLDDDW